MKLTLLAIRGLLGRFHIYRSVVGLAFVSAICVATTALLVTVGQMDVEAALTTSIYSTLAVVAVFLGLELVLEAIPQASKEELEAAYGDENNGRFVRQFAALELARSAKLSGATAWEAEWRGRAEAL